MNESRVRSWAKSLVWRAIGIALMPIVILAVYAFVGKEAGELALWTTVIFHGIRVILYYAHERLWLKTKWGLKQGQVVWLTGLPSCGKSSIAEAAEKRLHRNGYDVVTLDGDRVRKMFPKTGFSREERETHLRRVGHMAALLEAQGTIVLCSFVSPYGATRKQIRGMCTNFREVFVDCPLCVCEERDVKGLYKKARAGEIKQFTGISDPYEPPLSPELHLRTDMESVRTSTSKVLTLIGK